MKVSKCTIGKTHKWQWVENTTRYYLTHTKGRLYKVGHYKCECGAEKEGRLQ